MEIKGLEEVIRALRDRVARAQQDSNASVVVGYTASYALYVHEDLEALHGSAYNAAYITSTVNRRGKVVHNWSDLAQRMGYATGKASTRGANQQAKFLEQPAREFKDEIAGIIRQALQQGKTMSQALLLGGLRLQRESMQIVPVDKGNLKASAFTKLESGD